MNAPAKITADTIHSAMARAFAEIEGATKSANNPHFKSKYADLTSVIEAIKPALVANGLFFTQHPVPSQGGVTVRTWLHHASGDSLDLGELFVPANKNDAQAYGSALTYARRYALVTAFGVPVEDDDGNAASRGQERSGTNREVSPAPAMPDSEWAKLVQLIEASKADRSAMLGYFKVKDLRELDQQQYAECVEMLNAKLAKAAKSETNAKAGFADVLADEIPY